MSVRDLFPFGDLDDTVVAAAEERFPGLPAPEVGAAFALAKAVIGVLDTMSAGLAEFDISPARWRLLIALVVQSPPEGATMGELARHLDVREPTVTATVDRLEREGLVRRSRDEHDGRVVRVSITPAGVDLVRAVIPTITARLDSFVGAMGGPDATRSIAERLANATNRLAT